MSNVQGFVGHMSVTTIQFCCAGWTHMGTNERDCVPTELFFFDTEI